MAFVGQLLPHDSLVFCFTVLMKVVICFKYAVTIEISLGFVLQTLWLYSSSEHILTWNTFLEKLLNESIYLGRARTRNLSFI